MKNKKMFYFLILIVLVVGYFIYRNIDDAPTGNPDNLPTGDGKTVLFKTSMGDVKIKLHDNRPITTGNFLKLVEDGVYNGVIFHRVIDGFMIQGGDPTGTGRGDPQYPEIQDEFEGGNSNVRGTISMANRGPNTGSTQFFINLVDNNNLDDKHSVFGDVVEGMDIVDSIAKVEKDGSKPITDVVIEEASVI
jgi:peptidylprolyl isomerase